MRCLPRAGMGTHVRMAAASPVCICVTSACKDSWNGEEGRSCPAPAVSSGAGSSASSASTCRGSSGSKPAAPTSLSKAARASWRVFSASGPSWDTSLRKGSNDASKESDSSLPACFSLRSTMPCRSKMSPSTCGAVGKKEADSTAESSLPSAPLSQSAFPPPLSRTTCRGCKKEAQPHVEDPLGAHPESSSRVPARSTKRSRIRRGGAIGGILPCTKFTAGFCGLRGSFGTLT